MSEEPDNSYSVTVGPNLEIKQVMEIARLTSEGKPPKEIESELGLPLSTIRKAQAYLNIQALEGYVLNNPTLERIIVKAQAMKDMLTADSPRDRMAAAKIVIADPALGFANDNPVIKIELSEELKKLQPGKMAWEESEEK